MQLRILELNMTVLKIFFYSNIRSELSYAAQAWFYVPLKIDKARVETLQGTVTWAISLDLDCINRTDFIDLLLLCNLLIEEREALEHNS